MGLGLSHPFMVYHKAIPTDYSFDLQGSSSPVGTRLMVGNQETPETQVP